MQGFSESTPLSTAVENLWEKAGRAVPVCGSFPAPTPAVDNRFRTPRLYFRSPPPGGGFSFDPESLLEAHLPAQRPPPQAQARLPRAHVDPRRAGDPEAPPRQGPQAALRLSPPRLSSHRAAPEPPVPLAGLRRRLSQRPLGLDAVPRPLLVPARGGRRRTSRGSASPCRSRSGTPSSATGSSASCARRGASSPGPRGPATTTCSSPAPGLAEPADTRGHEWLAERVTEVLEKAAA